MTRTKTLSVPVRYAVPDPAGGKRNIVTPGSVEIREIDATAAPVVIEWRRGDKMLVPTIEYRLFEGRLWSVTTAEMVYGYVEPEDVAADPMAWKDHVSESAWSRAYHHPLLDNDHRPVVTGKSLSDVLFVADAGDNQTYARYLADARAKATRHLMIDGKIWAPCFGPILQNSYSDGKLEFRHLAEPMETYANSFDHMVFAVTDIDGAARHVRQVSGERPTLPDPDEIAILSPDGYEFDTLPISVQATALDVLWNLRRIPAGSAGGHLVEATVALRRAVSASWPDAELHFDFNQFHQAVRPLYGHPLPDPAAMLEPLREAVEATAEALPKMTREIVRWRFTVDLLHDRIHPIHQDDQDIIGAMTL